MVRPMLTASPYEMVSVETAGSIIVEQAPVLTTGQVAPWTAEGRVLAEDVRAAGPMPAEPRSAMDGYAIRAGDNSRRRLLGEITAGSAGAYVVGPGEAARIMTGGVLPSGADTVVMVEETREDSGHVTVLAEPRAGANIVPVGADLEPGELVVAAGTVLGPAEIGLLATLGVAHVMVYRKPRVAVLATGDELIEPWESPSLGSVRDSNRYALIAAVREAGGEVVWHGVARDDEAHLATQVNTALASADVLITSGGVSMGTRDLIKPLLETLGTIHFGRVNFKPGKPLTFASVSSKLVFGLPGNPVSSLVTFEVFVRPGLLKMGGRTTIFRARVEVEVDHEIRPDQSRPEYQRAVVRWEGGCLVARTTGSQSSSRLQSMQGANALLEIAPADHPLPARQRVPALLTGPIRNE